MRREGRATQLSFEFVCTLTAMSMAAVAGRPESAVRSPSFRAWASRALELVGLVDG